MVLFKKGKAHIPHRKNTADMPPVRMTPPATVKILMSQHIGAHAKPIVKPGDTVCVGTLIGEAVGYVSANVYSSVSGTVKKIEPYLIATGRTTDAVVIESDGNMTPDTALAPLTVTSFKELSDAAAKCGLVGLGGAGFPTAVKLDANKIDSIDTLVVNGAECEPYITSDTRTMIDEAESVKRGISLILDLSGIASAVIGIEKNKPEAIAKMTEIFADDARVTVMPLPTVYPQGGEKILIYNTTGRVVMEGELPASVGVLIMNVTTISHLAKFVDTGMPVVEKCVTVDGSAVKEPKNMLVPVGTSLGEVIDAAGGLKAEPGKVLCGGPMMGIAQYSLEAPITKTTNAIVVLDRKDAKIEETTPCIHCGRCVSVCPMGLTPTEFSKAMSLANSADRAERLDKWKVNVCIECGSCSYVCPAKRPLVENNRLAKADLRQFNADKAKKA